MAHVRGRNNWIRVVTPAIVCRPAMVRGLNHLLTGGITVLLIPFSSPPVLRACLHIHQAVVVVVVSVHRHGGQEPETPPF